jgi:hypothetical protein
MKRLIKAMAPEVRNRVRWSGTNLFIWAAKEPITTYKIKFLTMMRNMVKPRIGSGERKASTPIQTVKRKTNRMESKKLLLIAILPLLKPINQIPKMRTVRISQGASLILPPI